MVDCTDLEARFPEIHAFFRKKFLAQHEALKRFAAMAVREAPEVIMLGGSVIDQRQSGESEATAVDSLLGGATSARILSFHQGAASFLLYGHMFRMLGKPVGGGTVLMQINLRSFSNEWFLRPAYNFREIEAIVDPGLGLSQAKRLERYAARLIGLLAETNDLFKSGDYPVPVRGERHTHGSLLKALRSNEAIKNLFYYCYPGEWLEPRVETLMRAVRLMRARGYTVMGYLTPINRDSIARTCDKEEYDRFEDNVAILVRLLEQQGMAVLNLALDLDESCFADGTEHLTLKGRELLAARLARSLNAMPGRGGRPGMVHANLPDLSVVLPRDMEAYAYLGERMTVRGVE